MMVLNPASTGARLSPALFRAAASPATKPSCRAASNRFCSSSPASETRARTGDGAPAQRNANGVASKVSSDRYSLEDILFPGCALQTQHALGLELPDHGDNLLLGLLYFLDLD